MQGSGREATRLREQPLADARPRRSFATSSSSGPTPPWSATRAATIERSPSSTTRWPRAFGGTCSAPAAIRAGRTTSCNRRCCRSIAPAVASSSAPRSCPGPSRSPAACSSTAFAGARTSAAPSRSRRAATRQAPWRSSPSQHGADELIDVQRLARALEAELERLPESHRAAFELIKNEGLSIREAAEVLGATPTAVKLRAHRAYAALRAALGRLWSIASEGKSHARTRSQATSPGRRGLRSVAHAPAARDAERRSWRSRPSRCRFCCFALVGGPRVGPRPLGLVAMTALGTAGIAVLRAVPGGRPRVEHARPSPRPAARHRRDRARSRS